jgi:hypothetical protein
MSRGLPQLPRRWWSISLPGYRDHPEVYGTYSAFDFDELPPVGRDLDEDLAWLNREPVVPRSLGERAEGDPEPARMATAEQLGLLMESADVALPISFSTFIRSTEPRRRVRSATACYLELAEFAVPVVGGGKLVHFLSDQQWVLHWLLYAGLDGSEAVIVTEDPVGFEARDESPRASAHEFDPSSTDAAVCAESFPEFLYRFWIENQIWFALAGGESGAHPLSAEQGRYLSHYRLPGPPND